LEEEVIAAASAHASLFQAYVEGRATAFYRHHPGAVQARSEAVSSALRPLAPQVASALRTQNAGLPPSPAREANLTALEAGAAVVVTGQQVGLFLGPLYTLYKAATAIAVSRALASETGRPVVPVFWLQTEDHDLPEIATCSVPRDGQPALELSVPCDQGSRISIAHHALPAEIAECVRVLSDELGRLPHAAPHLERIARAYRPGATWSGAFAQVLSGLFAPEGLIVIDPRDPMLAAHTLAVHRKALRDAPSLARELCARADALQAAGYAPQVHVREGAPLCFFHVEHARGARHRLTPCATGYAEVGAPAEHTLPELLATLESDPLRFSSSALLRPIVQDTLLPTAAYVGGPSEVEYFAQVEPLYAAYGMTMPLIVPRARFRVLEPKTVRLLSRLALHADDASRTEDELLAQLAARDADHISAETLERELTTRLHAAIDDTLSRANDSVRAAIQSAEEKTKGFVQSAAGKLADKYRQALGHQNQAHVRDVRGLRHSLYPGGSPQERVYGLSYFAARYGERAFIETTLAAIDPFELAQKDLHP
jgi:bacillithiol biosynthesis cysteine-adding enzyme BshC